MDSLPTSDHVDALLVDGIVSAERCFVEDKKQLVEAFLVTTKNREFLYNKILSIKDTHNRCRRRDRDAMDVIVVGLTISTL